MADIDLSNEACPIIPTAGLIREKYEANTRRNLAYLLFAFMVFVFIGIFVVLFHGPLNTDKINTVTTLYTTLCSPIVTLVASVLSFYFGSKAP